MRIVIVSAGSCNSLVENLDKIMNGFQISEIIIVDIDADAEVKASVTAVNDLEITELERKNRGRLRLDPPMPPIIPRRS